jgi:predicted O-methyltransferase YrrM
LERTFGLSGGLRHLRQTSQQAIAAGGLPQPIDLLFIDGDHSCQGVKYDSDHVGRHVRAGGLILMHDSIREGKGFTPWEVKRFLQAEVSGRAQYETLTLPRAAGLALVR